MVLRVCLFFVLRRRGRAQSGQRVICADSTVAEFTFCFPRSAFDVLEHRGSPLISLGGSGRRRWGDCDDADDTMLIESLSFTTSTVHPDVCDGETGCKGRFGVRTVDQSLYVERPVVGEG
jgi:hypothetical protein